MTKEEIILANHEYLFPSVFHYFKTPLVIWRAKDQYVWDADGKQYLDFFGGIVTVSVGHCNETVNRQLHRQIDTLQHISTVFANEPQAALAKRVAEVTPGRKLTKSFITNSGTEANETAILTARCYTGSSEIVALRHSYHGRSALAMAASGQATWRLGGVAQPGFVHAHNAYCYRCPLGMKPESCGTACASDVEDVIRTTTSGRPAAYIAEPIMGVGGFIVPPKEYPKLVAEIVKRHEALYIADEVQTGWGRTGGKWFGIEQYGVQPDIITAAKGLANGSPIGLTVARPEIADALKGATISTFGGNPVTATAAKAVIDYIDENHLAINAAEVGGYLRSHLEQLQNKYSIIGEVRGMGLLQAMELVEDRESKKPAAAATLQVMEAARENGLLIGKGGTYANCIRISPPMNISRNDVDEFASKMDSVFARVTSSMAAGVHG